MTKIHRQTPPQNLEKRHCEKGEILHNPRDGIISETEPVWLGVHVPEHLIATALAAPRLEGASDTVWHNLHSAGDRPSKPSEGEIRGSSGPQGWAWALCWALPRGPSCCSPWPSGVSRMEATPH